MNISIIKVAMIALPIMEYLSRIMHYKQPFVGTKIKQTNIKCMLNDDALIITKCTLLI